MKISERIARLRELQGRLRANKFRQSKLERNEVIGELAGLLVAEGLHDMLMQAGQIFSVDGLSSGRYESTLHQVDTAVVSAITRLKSGADEAEAGNDTVNDFWDDIHPAIKAVAEARYASGHYADAVEAAFKEIETIVKRIHVAAGKAEQSGNGLMKSAFSVNNPTIRLANLTTASGKDIQQGYLEIAAGAMTGIRNPKAHANIIIDDKRARHHLYIASLIAQVVDERHP